MESCNKNLKKSKMNRLMGYYRDPDSINEKIKGKIKRIAKKAITFDYEKMFDNEDFELTDDQKVLSMVWDVIISKYFYSLLQKIE